VRSDICLAGWEPSELRLPEKFTEFRPAQLEAVEWAANLDKRFGGMCLPTGAGKTLIAMALARVTGMRTAILTSTRGLQEQYMAEFGMGGLVNIKGRANYQCADKPPANCRMGPHSGCGLAGDLGCTYESERWTAKNADIIVPNYAYWIRANERGRGLDLTEEQGGPNPVELLVLDEGHRVAEELSRALRVSMRETHIRAAHLGYDPKCEDLVELAAWAREGAVDAGVELKMAIEALKRKASAVARDRVYELEELVDGLERVGRMNPEHWVVEQRKGTEWGRVWDYDCVWPGSWAESRLFVGVSKVVLMSATLRPLTMRMLGIPVDKGEFREWPRVFPATHTPIYHVPTVRMKYGVGEEELRKWIGRIDEIIESRLDRKGLVHTVSYARQQYLLAHSRFARHFVVNTNTNTNTDSESETAASVVERFKSMDAPAILVSPSFGTGWDFPGRTAEWIIVAKIPIPPAVSKVMQARKERNKQYIDYLAMQDLVQSCGRGTRSAEDRCEVFIVDDSIRWFMLRNKKLAPGWFSVQDTSGVPKPGKRVVEEGEIWTT